VTVGAAIGNSFPVVPLESKVTLAELPARAPDEVPSMWILPRPEGLDGAPLAAVRREIYLNRPQRDGGPAQIALDSKNKTGT